MEVVNVKSNEFAKLVFIYTLKPVDDVCCIFPLIHVQFIVSSLFLASIINLLNFLSSFLARFISWKFPFVVFEHNIHPLMSIRCNASLTFKMFLLLILILFLMLLFVLLYVKVMELLKSILYWSLLNMYIFLVLCANAIVLS